MTSFYLPTLNEAQRETLLLNAQQVLEAQQLMTKKNGKNLVHYTLKRKRKHLSMQHYPKGDRIDYQTGAQYFYHCHRENFESEEHGHFHCFLRYKCIPASITPMPLPDWDKHINNPMTHLIAIAMNRYGQPIRLFTVNRWISFEIVYGAEHAAELLSRYKMTLEDDPYWQILDRWVEGMLHVFAPQIIWLQKQRDAFMAKQTACSPDVNAYENREIEEISSIDIDLSKQIQWLLHDMPDMVNSP